MRSGMFTGLGTWWIVADTLDWFSQNPFQFLSSLLSELQRLGSWTLSASLKLPCGSDFVCDLDAICVRQMWTLWSSVEGELWTRWKERQVWSVHFLGTNHAKGSITLGPAADGGSLVVLSLLDGGRGCSLLVNPVLQYNFGSHSWMFSLGHISFSF